MKRRFFFYKSLSNVLHTILCSVCFQEVHTVIFGGDHTFFSGMGGGLVIEQRGFFLSHEGLRLSWLEGYGSRMEWNDMAADGSLSRVDSSLLARGCGCPGFVVISRYERAYILLLWQHSYWGE